MHCPSKNEQKAVAACFKKIVLFLSIATKNTKLKLDKPFMLHYLINSS